MKERDLAPRLSLAAAFLILALPLLWPLLTWRIFPSGDLTQFHLPIRFIYQDALRHGNTFLWSSALGSGVYLHAEGQTGMAHPFHLLLYRLLPLTAAFNLEMLASYAAAAFGTWRLLRRFAFRAEAAGAGALMFAFSGFNLMHLNHINMIAVVAHAPWMLIAADMLLTGPDGRTRALGFAATAGLFGSQILLGFPQSMWFNALILGWFALCRAPLRTHAERVLLLGAALAAGMMIGGVQLLPTLDLMQSSLRAETTMAFRLSFSLYPVNLVQLVSPYFLRGRIYAPGPDEHFMHEFTIYGGALATMSACWVAVRWRELRRHREVVALLCLAGAGLILALGRFGGVYTLLAHLPGIANLRGATRHILLVHVAFAGLVAIAIEDLLDMPLGRVSWRALRPLWIPVFMAGVLALAAWMPATVAWLSGRGILLNPIRPVLMGTALVTLAAILFALAARGHRTAVSALLLMTGVDLAVWGVRYTYAAPPVRIEAVQPWRGIPAGAAPGDLVRPSAVRNDMNLYAMHQLRSSTVYLGLTPATVLNPYLPIAKRVAGVTWDWTEFGWQRVKNTMPRARLVSEWQVSHDIASDAERVDISRVALVSLPPGALSGQPGTARLAVDRAGVLVVDTDAPAPQLLVLTERFHQGWHADVDGTASMPLVRVFGDYMGGIVPAGRHRITLRFAPASARYGLWTTLVGLVATAGGYFGLRKARISSPRRT